MENLENIRVNYAQACALRNIKNAKIIDVRSLQEHEQASFPETDIQIDLFSDFENKIKALDKETLYICYCQSGGRSQSAAAIMKEHGFNATDVIGGILG